MQRYLMLWNSHLPIKPVLLIDVTPLISSPRRVPQLKKKEGAFFEGTGFGALKTDSFGFDSGRMSGAGAGLATLFDPPSFLTDAPDARCCKAPGAAHGAPDPRPAGFLNWSNELSGSPLQRSGNTRPRISNLGYVFKRGRGNFEDEARTIATAVTQENVHELEKWIRENRRIEYVELERELCIESAAMQTTIHDHLSLHKRCSRWLPHKLTDEQNTAR
ncbi:hypothetical protein EVAR_37062_1 [Eumeta japonica]|uniref:Uncharacterized protein n=1 Tax=Eumeta variegata TaxID=151549 RepID=A0A4C1WIK3_EUMVA|nr:hypothetical protein EVAR_37062_1 [Eumeta japonica]